MTASSVSQVYRPGSANDGDQSTYWESANNAFPQWLQVDLGASVNVNQVVLKLPVANWGARTQTLSVQGSPRTPTSPTSTCFSASKTFQGIRVNDVDIVDPTYSGIMFQTNYSGGTAQNPITDTIFTNVSITGAKQSGDAFNAKSGYGVWANPLPEAGQGPAVGSATFNHLTESGNFVDIQNTTTTFHITVNP